MIFHCAHNQLLQCDGAAGKPHQQTWQWSQHLCTFHINKDSFESIKATKQTARLYYARQTHLKKTRLVVLRNGSSNPTCLLAGCIGKTDMALSPNLVLMHTDLKLSVQNLQQLNCNVFRIWIRSHMHKKNPHGTKCIAMTVMSPFKHGLPFHVLWFWTKKIRLQRHGQILHWINTQFEKKNTC